MNKVLRRSWGLFLACGFVLALGCSDGASTGEVTGTVTVNGEIPAEGSSITFFPTDGKSPSAGAMLEKGKYTVKVPVGTAKVEIRAPRAIVRKGAAKGGPGPGGDRIEESLPAEYNNSTTLTIDVKAGSQEKNWELKVPAK